MYLIFDTETTGSSAQQNCPDNRPLKTGLWFNWLGNCTIRTKLLSIKNFIVKPEGFDIPFKAEQVHGISTARATKEERFGRSAHRFSAGHGESQSWLVGHNIEFDNNIIGAEYLRLKREPKTLLDAEKVDTGLVSIEYCQLSGGIGGKLKCRDWLSCIKTFQGRILAMRTMPLMMWPPPHDVSLGWLK